MDEKHCDGTGAVELNAQYLQNAVKNEDEECRCEKESADSRALPKESVPDTQSHEKLETENISEEILSAAKSFDPEVPYKQDHLDNPVNNSKGVIVEISKEPTMEEHDLDSLFQPLGGFGAFQWWNILCLATIITLCTFSELGYVMTTAELEHRCLIPECEANNSTYSEAENPWLSAAIPKNSVGGFDSCRRFNFSATGQCSNLTTSTEAYQCQEFVYATEEWTIHREDWGIHCDNQRYQLNLVGSLNNAGQVVGGFYAGYLQDRFGRKTALVSMTLMVAIVGAIKSFSINYAMMTALEVLETMGAVGLFNGPFVLALEIVAPERRVLAGAIIALAYPCGEMALGCIQYLTLNWRNTLRICYCPFFLTITFYWLLPESVRWLLSQERYDDAVLVLKKMARMNKKKFPEDAVKKVLVAEAEKVKMASKGEEINGKEGFKEVWRSKRLRNRILATLLTRMCALFVYFGITLNSVSISENKFLNFILTGLIEMPGYFSVFMLMDRIGRKPSLWTHLVLCGVSCILTGYVPNEWGWLRLVLYLAGKFGASGGLFVSDIYTAEMYPTFIRSTMLSVSVLVGKLASVVAPEIPLLADFYEPLPLLIFGLMSLLGASVTFIFPETLHTKLPDTIEEAENLGKKDCKSPSCT